MTVHKERAMARIDRVIDKKLTEESRFFGSVQANFKDGRLININITQTVHCENAEDQRTKGAQA